MSQRRPKVRKGPNQSISDRQASVMSVKSVKNHLYLDIPPRAYARVCFFALDSE